MRILVLGHNGMLGNALCRYFKEQTGIELLTMTARYPSPEFRLGLKDSRADFIVNCIGAIPQKNPSPAEYELLNDTLPRELDELGIPVVHPSTDCEFDGSLPPGERYGKDHSRDAKDEYGKSKAAISAWIERGSQNTKIIRTSIVGHEVSSTVSLLNWFLSQTEPVNGYTDQYWSGITTLEWAHQCHILIRDWKQAPKLIQLAAPECVSKCRLLELFKEAYSTNTVIVPSTSGKPTNKCLLSDVQLSSIKDQLLELKTFYGR